MGPSEFVAGWLILKAAGSWKGWHDGYGRAKRIHGRALFQTFLIAAGLRVAWGVAGGIIIGLLAASRPQAAIAVGLGVLLMTITIRIWAKLLPVKPQLVDDQA